MMAVILESAARTLLMAAIAWAALRLLRVRHVAAQKIAWSLVLAAAIAMPFLMRRQWVKVRPVVVPASWGVPVHSGAQAADRAAARVVNVAAPAAEPVEPRIAMTAATIEIAPAAAVSTVQETQKTGQETWSWSRVRSEAARMIVPVYLAVSGILLLRLMIGLALAYRIWLRAERASALVEPRATVRFSEDLSTPVTIGSGIVLPASFEEWSREKLRIVLAHERAHVRQADFYLQLLARLHTAIFWFSPAAWWMQKELSDLGEAISDYAGIEEAADAPSYAEVLLEVAAMPRQPVFGVAMARSSRIQQRLDRLLIEGLFRRAFVDGRRRIVAAVAVVPVAVIAATSLVAVRAAEKVTPASAAILHVVAQNSNGPVAPPDMPPFTVKVPTAPLPNVRLADPVTREAVTMSPVPPTIAQANPPAVTVERDSDTYFSDSDKESFMIVNGDQSHMFNYHGDYEAMGSIRKRLHGNYIVSERDGKYYVIDDPALVAQSLKLFEPTEELGRQQEALGAQQQKLGEQQAQLGKKQQEAHIATPDMSKEIAELQDAVQKLQELEKSKTVTQSELAGIQGRIGGIEGRLGAMQGQIGAQEGEIGRQEGELGRKQGELGRQQGELGRQQGRLAREASRQMQVTIDQAFKDGKAKPVQ
jgi:beta-lactamase regulating signal transducer with metallopeptidase domain